MTRSRSLTTTTYLIRRQRPSVSVPRLPGRGLGVRDHRGQSPPHLNVPPNSKRTRWHHGHEQTQDAYLGFTPFEVMLHDRSKHLAGLGHPLVPQKTTTAEYRLTIARIYGSLAVNPGRTCCIMNSSMLPLTSGWRIMNGPSAAVMFNAPNFSGGAALLGQSTFKSSIHSDMALTSEGHCSQD